MVAFWPGVNCLFGAPIVSVSFWPELDCPLGGVLRDSSALAVPDNIEADWELYDIVADWNLGALSKIPITELLLYELSKIPEFGVVSTNVTNLLYVVAPFVIDVVWSWFVFNCATEPKFISTCPLSLKPKLLRLGYKFTSPEPPRAEPDSGNAW